MANYFSHFAFSIPASRADAERLIQVIIAARKLEAGEVPELDPDIASAFREAGKSEVQVLAEIIDGYLGIDCHFDAANQQLTLYDTEGTPHLAALAQLLQRLFPEKLPLGFVYADTCDKSRADAFGGGFYVIAAETIRHQNLHEILDFELNDVRETGDDA